MKILLIDDEVIYYKQLLPATKKAGYELEYARSGAEGIAAISAMNPDLLIVDLRLPDIDGFEIMSRLRRDPDYSHVPVMIITGKDDLQNKLKAFEIGADDFLVKPFEPEELVARLGILARRGKAMKFVHQMEVDHKIARTIVTVHSLRGGAGCSSLSLNLALAFQALWGRPTLLVDAVLTAGQLTLMMDASPRVTWGEYINVPPNEINDTIIDDLIGSHSNGLNYVAAPRYPISIDSVPDEFWRVMIENFIKRHEFIIVDTAHDFSDPTITMLNASTNILMIVAPEMAALRAGVSALNIYERLGFPDEKIKIVLNHPTSTASIKQSQLEKALKREINAVIPYEPIEVLRAINFGQPFYTTSPDIPISATLERLAYELSNEIHKNIPPAAPSLAWKRAVSHFK